MEYVYVLQHSYELEDEEEVKFVGVFSTEPEAQNAIDFLRTKEGFKDYPVDCFIIDKYKINEIHWTEGFITVYT